MLKDVKTLKRVFYLDSMEIVPYFVTVGHAMNTRGFNHRLNTKEKKNIQREKTIIQAALDLFTQKGIESVTIDMIAGQARVGKGTIYKHFSSKNDIFATLIIEQGHQMMDILLAVPQDAPVMVQLKMTMRGIWDFQIQDIQKLAVYRKCDQLLLMDDMSPDVLLRFNQQNQARNDFIRAMIQKAIDEQIFMDESLEKLSAVSVGLFRGVFDLILEGEVEPTEDLYLLVEKMIFKGFMR